MPNAIEILQDVRDRLGNLPWEIAETLRLTLPSPQQPATAAVLAPLAAEALQPVQTAVMQMAEAPAVPSLAGSLPTPSLASFPASAAPEPMPALAGGGLVPPAAPTPASFATPAPALAAAVGADVQPLTGKGDGNTEVLDLLREIRENQAQPAPGGESSRQGRVPPPPGQVPWSVSWEAPQEGYAGAASPSFDVSNRAGIAGASSSRGFGSNLRGNRYQQPDVGIPR